MIGRAFRSEWVKFLRRGQLLGSWGTMVGFGLLVAVLLLGYASELSAEELAQQPATQGDAPVIPKELVEASDGGAFAFQATGQLLGVIALVIAAANMATEYTSGTLKVLLVREPRRGVLLSGKIVALWSFVLVGVLVTLLVTVLGSAVVATARGIETSAWWTGDGLAAIGQAAFNVGLGAMVWAVLGVVLAVLFRSGFPAIGVGIAYPLVVEGLLNLVLPDLVKWMPGAVLGRLAQGGTTQALGQGMATEPLSYATALGMTLLYALVFCSVAAVTLRRRDVA